LEATINCLISHGYAGTTTSSITEAANVARGAFSHHFGTREELMLAAMDHLASKRGHDIEIALGAVDSALGIEGFLETFRKKYSADLYYAQNELWTAARTDPRLQQMCREFGDHTQAIINRIFERFFGAEAMSRTELPFVVMGLQNMLRGLATMAMVRSEREIRPHWLYWRGVFAAAIEKELRKVRQSS
jgi:AcrR family transcriptional regulator